MSSASAIARAQQALEAGRRARVVGHARLVPACDDDAAQMRFAVEDALNTADFGDAGRLVLVRRLKVADLPPRASPALVARAMESAWRSLALRAVPAVHPSAARAEAVFFVSRFEARMAWLAKVAGGESPGAWFWPAALPELKALPMASKAAAIECVIEAALRDSEPAVVEALTHWHDAPLVALTRAMPASSQRRLLRVLASSQVVAQRGAAALVARVRAAKALPRPLAAVAQRLAAWTPMDEAAANVLAAIWLEPVLQRRPTMEEIAAVASRAVWMASRSLSSSARHQGEAEQSLARMADVSLAEASTPAPDEDLEPASRWTAEPARQQPPIDARPRGTSWKVESGLAPQAQPRATAKTQGIEYQPAWPWLLDAVFTRFGGLMLVLNVLSAIRFDRWLQGVDAALRLAFVHALLSHAMDAAGASKDEPQRAWLDEAARPFDSTAAVHSSIRLWTLRLRRTLRRHARMDLADLVRRDAWVSATPTHIDVVYAIDTVDMRLRRLGLDADPGWVPWFGRIVNFHFIEAQMLPPTEEDTHG